jgi:mannose-6-phosphate isomerase-like protein (cupin superfamily)
MRKIVRFADAKKYEAPLHDVTVHSMYLQHKSMGSGENFWVAVSYYLPGAKAQMSAAPLERVYVILEGQLTVQFEDETVILNPMDSVYIGPNETREARNDTNRVVTILVVMPYPPAS